MKILALLSVALAGCASSSSIVKKPEVLAVKRIAIIGLTAPQKVPNRNGKGQIAGWSESMRQAIADDAFAAFAAEMKLLGWEAIPAATIGALPQYREDFAPTVSKASGGVGGALNRLRESDVSRAYFAPTGLSPVLWDDGKGKNGELRLDLGNLSLQKTKDLKTKMQETAAAAGADASVLIQLDYCYEDGSVWAGHAKSGTGSAVITAASALYAVTPKGVDVLRMNRIEKSCAGDKRVASDTESPMAKNVLLHSDARLRKMFAEASRKTAAESVKTIQAAIHR